MEAGEGQGCGGGGRDGEGPLTSPHLCHKTTVPKLSLLPHLLCTSRFCEKQSNISPLLEAKSLLSQECTSVFKKGVRY